MMRDTILETYKKAVGYAQLDIDKCEVYWIHHIDWITFMPFANEVLEPTKENILLMAKIMKKFQEAGWEGDGELQIGWIPPFLTTSIDFGTIFWHVKQANNGTSFILIDKGRVPFLSNIADQLHKR